MKLLIVTPYFYPKIGGVEKYVYEIGSRLVKDHDLEVSIICSHWERNRYEEEYIQNMKIFRLPFSFKIASTPINSAWYTKIMSIVKKEKPDIINGHIPVPYIADLAAYVARRRKINYVLTYHNDLTGYNIITKTFSKLYYPIIGSKTFNYSQRIIATSEYYAKISPYLKRFDQKLKIVSPGIDAKHFNVQEKNYLKNKHDLKKEKIVLFVGQLNKESKHKGLDYLIQAVKELNDLMDLKLIIVGTGDYMNYYKKLAQYHGIKAIFTGFVSENELPKYYNGSDLLALPSYNMAEGFGMVLIEAQACGIPVIGTRIGGIPYAVKDGITGLLVPPKDSTSLADAINKILSNENLSKKMGYNGRNRVKNEFTWDKSTVNFLNIIKEVQES